jgi:maltose alpha-D-glucosyltransferase / alpha-amylase
MQANSANRALLDLFLIEKAAYEIAYEAGNRPSWIGVPLAGLARLAGRILKGHWASHRRRIERCAAPV